MRARPMIPLYRRGQVWWCWFYNFKGRRLRRSTRQRDRGLAAAAAMQIARAYLQGADPDPVSLDEALGLWLAHSQRRGRADGTLRFYAAKSRPLLAVFSERNISSLTLRSVEHYVDRRYLDGAAPQTVAKEVGVLTAALRHMRRHGRYGRDPREIVPDSIRGTYVPRDRCLTRWEYEALWEALSPDRRDYLVAYCGLGPRDAELRRIAPHDVDLAHRVVHIQGTKTARSDRWVPLNPVVKRMLQRRMAAASDRVLFPRWRNCHRDLRAACRRAKIEPVTCNDFRRTFATWLAERGVSESVVASLMGSSSLLVRRVYTRVGRSAAAQAIAQLPLR